MRIASISLHWPRTKDSGVGKKLDRQIKIWQAGGHEARLFLHTSRPVSSSALVPAEVIPYDSAGTVATELARSRAARELVAAVRAWCPDIIYLRLAMYVYPVHCLAEIAPLVGEANTNDLTQHEGLGKVYALYNRLTRGLLLRRLDGLVTVSRELAEASAFARYRQPTRVIANGIDLENFAPLPAPSNRTPRLAFIANPGYLWHGVDKLITLARLIPDVHIDIIGYDTLPAGRDFVAQDGIPRYPENLHLHGYLPASEYTKILGNADAAISSLALHRIGLEEASPLKSRECLALGLPLVLAYMDTDLRDLKADFLLRIPNKEDNIRTHAAAIRDFACRMRGRRVDRALIASLDQKVKERQRLQFFEEIVLSRRRDVCD
ncbi:MAG: glycosyltransferase [Chloroflexota bacterium]